MELVFQKLTPTNDIDIKVYEEAMEYIYDNFDVRNIAISGPYGAGKSSLLETFKKVNVDKSFLTVSLARFNEENNENKSVSDKTIAVLEGKIINQLIQQISTEKITQTNFRVKRTVGFWCCFRTVIEIIVFSLVVFYMVYYKELVGWIKSLSDSIIKSIFSVITNPYSHIVVFIVAIGIFGSWLFFIVKEQKTKNVFRKLKLQGNEIEIFAEENDSYFDRYLNEVLYLFENSGADSVIFEDMDRYDDIRIFERLREINTLINVRLKNQKQKRVIRFFYLLKDDMFLNKERTKFFDFIVPVIPVVDNSNSYNKLKEYFTESKILHYFDDKFLRSLSLYIDDMRVLKNIYNEFIIYFYKLQEIAIDPNKMLAMITYKNVFPKDFADLQLNKGILKEVFHKKETLISDMLKNYQNQIDELQERIEAIKKEHLESLEELEDVRVRKSNRANNSYDVSVRKKYQMWYDNEYPIRKRVLEDKEQGSINELEKKLIQYRKEYETIKNKKLYELITRENISSLFKATTTNEIGEVIDYNEIKRSEYFDLLKFLVWRGYIDESYSDYMSFFYPNSLSVKDKIFLRSVMDKKSLEHTYKLDNPNIVLNSLGLSDFGQKEILNYDLLLYLLHNNHQEYLECMIQQIRDKKYYEFTVEFYRLGKGRKDYVIALNSQWPEFFETVKEMGKMTEEELHQYSIDTLLYLSESQLNGNAQTYLKEYISNKEDYLMVKDVDIEKMILSLKELGVSFVKIKEGGYDKKLFDKIYMLSMYDINIDNIQLILKDKYAISSMDRIKTRYISTIFQRKEEVLYKYVCENLNLLLEVVLNEEIDVITDDYEVVINIINNDNISSQNITAYISKLKTIIRDLSAIENESYKTELMRLYKVAYTEENILTYYMNFGLSDELILFINNAGSELNFKRIKEKKEEIINKFWNDCAVCNELDDEKYTMIISSIDHKYEVFVEQEGISKEKIDILINIGSIPMEPDSLEYMREQYPQNVLHYIKKNLGAYVNITENEMKDEEEIISILSWDVEVELKKKLLSRVLSPISVELKDYSEEIMDHILKYNLDFEDIPYLCDRYEQYSPLIKKRILLVAKHHVEKLVEFRSIISSEILIEIMKDDNIDVNQAVKLLIINMEYIDHITCRQCIEQLGFVDIAKLFDKSKRPTIANSELAYEIMSGLKDNGYLLEFSIDAEKDVYRYTRGKID